MPYSKGLASHRHAPSRASAARRALVAFLFVSGCILAGMGNSPVLAAETAAPVADTKAGEALFTANCAACHADGGNLIDPKKPVRGSAKLKDFDAFLSWIRMPTAPMPPFAPDQIPDAKARDLYRYVVEELGSPKQK